MEQGVALMSEFCFLPLLLGTHLQAKNLRLPRFWVVHSMTLIFFNHMGSSVILNDFLKGLDSISLIASVFSGQLRSLLQFGVSLGCCPEQTIEELWDFFLFFLLLSYKFYEFQIDVCWVYTFFKINLIKDGRRNSLCCHVVFAYRAALSSSTASSSSSRLPSAWDTSKVCQLSQHSAFPTYWRHLW